VLHGTDRLLAIALSLGARRLLSRGQQGTDASEADEIVLCAPPPTEELIGEAQDLVDLAAADIRLEQRQLRFRLALGRRLRICCHGLQVVHGEVELAELEMAQAATEHALDEQFAAAVADGELGEPVAGLFEKPLALLPVVQPRPVGAQPVEEVEGV